MTNEFKDGIVHTLVLHDEAIDFAVRNESPERVAYCKGAKYGYITGLRAILSANLVDELVAEAEEGTE